MSEKINEYFDDELAIQEAEPTTKQPSLYKVIRVEKEFADYLLVKLQKPKSLL